MKWLTRVFCSIDRSSVSAENLTRAMPTSELSLFKMLLPNILSSSAYFIWFSTWSKREGETEGWAIICHSDELFGTSTDHQTLSKESKEKQHQFLTEHVQKVVSRALGVLAHSLVKEVPLFSTTAFSSLMPHWTPGLPIGWGVKWSAHFQAIRKLWWSGNKGPILKKTYLGVKRKMRVFCCSFPST